MRKAAWLIAAAAISIVGPAYSAEMFADVPTDHWAYQAVNSLQEQGIVIGYPDGTFGGRRAMTRYEFAVATARLLDWVNKRIDASGADKIKGLQDQIDALKNQSPGVSEDRVRQMIDDATRDLPTRQDLDTIRRLVDEFKNELATLGTDVEQSKRDIQSLKRRVGDIEERLNRWKISGEGNFIVRGSTSRPVTIRNLAGAVASGRNQVVDLDGRVDLNNTGALLQNLTTLYSLDLGITGQVTPDVTANALLNVGNYLPYVGTNRLDPAQGLYGGSSSASSLFPYNPRSAAAFLPGASQGNFGSDARAEGNADFALLKANIQANVPDLGPFKDLGVTLGKFGEKFTPYTFEQVDPDSYTNVTDTDNREIIVTGGEARTKVGPINVRTFFGTHYVGTLGSSLPGAFPLTSPVSTPTTPNGTGIFNRGYGVFWSWGGPAAFGVPYGAYAADQSWGVHGSFKVSRFNVGATYLRSGLTTGYGQLPTTQAGQVISGNVQFPFTKNISFHGEVASSNLLAPSGTNTYAHLGDTQGDLPSSLHNAYDARVNVKFGRITLDGGYKQIDPYFGAPGYWGNLGRWKNPTNIEGPNATVGVRIMPRLSLVGSWADYSSVRILNTGPGTTLADLGGLGRDKNAANHIQDYKVGLRFGLTSSNNIDLGWAQTRLRMASQLAATSGFTPNGADRETYWTVGLGHSFTPNTSLKLEYQFIHYDPRGQSNLGLGTTGVYGAPYRGSVAVGQFQVKF